MKIILGDIRVTLLDDLDTHINVPLISLALTSITADVADWTWELGVFASIKISLNYYNDKNQKWEPLLEQWVLEFKVLPNIYMH